MLISNQLTGTSQITNDRFRYIITDAWSLASDWCATSAASHNKASFMLYETNARLHLRGVVRSAIV